MEGDYIINPFRHKRDTNIPARDETPKNTDIDAIIDEFLASINHQKHFVDEIQKRISRVHIMSYESAYGGLMFEDE